LERSLDAALAPPQPKSTESMTASFVTFARTLDRSVSRLNRTHIAVLGLALAASFSIWLVQGLKGGERVKGSPGDVTASLDSAPEQLGPSGLPLPRFVTLKTNKVNVRKGPSSDHAVAWVFQRKGMPVEITAEFENWRKIRDSEGEEGWILQHMLSGRRFAMAATWAKEKLVSLHDDETAGSAITANLSSGAIAQVKSCDGEWCYMVTDDYEGYAKQTELWGVYPGEVVD
jgi:SH3-like domain-containing protein